MIQELLKKLKEDEHCRKIVSDIFSKVVEFANYVCKMIIQSGCDADYDLYKIIPLTFACYQKIIEIVLLKFREYCEIRFENVIRNRVHSTLNVICFDVDSIYEKLMNYCDKSKVESVIKKYSKILDSISDEVSDLVLDLLDYLCRSCDKI